MKVGNKKNKKETEKMNLKERKAQPRQKIENIVLIFFFLMSLIIWSQPAMAQLGPTEFPNQNPQAKSKPHFYNIDREITVEGQIEDLRFESRYEGQGHFLILTVKDKKSDELLEVETAPAWFFRIDIHKGEKIRFTGSLLEDQNQGKKMVIAREVKINNQTITLRDRRGFPTWSGGQGRRKGSTG
ncbi:MAG: hypothetical protein ACPLRA_03710 [Candidatus Saccharicenans sp.]